MRGLSFYFFFQNNSSLRKIEGRHFQIHFVIRFQLGCFPPASGRDVPQQPMPIHQLHPKERRLFQYFHYRAFKADDIFSRHVKISGSPSVMSTVCSKWADNEPSWLTTVQPSFKTFTPGNPAFTIGSMAIVIPGRNFSDFLPSTKFGT